MDYSLEQFKGKLELLIKLLEKGEMLAHELKLIELCEQLSCEVMKSKERSCEDSRLNDALTPSESATEMVSLASIAKAKLELLGASSSSSEELESAIDWFEDLQAYAKMKLSAKILFERQLTTSRRYTRAKFKAKTLYRPLTWEEAQEKLSKLMKKPPLAKPPPQLSCTPDEGLSVQECMQNILKTLETKKRLLLSSWIAIFEKPDMISYFLAILELFKRRKLQLLIEESEENNKKDESLLWIQAC